jgi:glycine/D-amino acid oxidase-like deaminating enzyme
MGPLYRAGLGDLVMKKRVGIIGGGIIGCSLAYYLTLYEGIEPYVIEKDQLGSVTTSMSAGTVSLLDDSIPEHLFDLRVLALRTYIGMENESKGSAGFNDIGTLAICPFTDYGRQSTEFVQMMRPATHTARIARITTPQRREGRFSRWGTSGVTQNRPLRVT